MRGARTLIVCLLGVVACTGPGTPRESTPAQGSTKLAPASTDPHGQPSPVHPATLPVPYPKRWIEEAREAETNSMTCRSLIYKDDCKIVRVGLVRLAVELRADGAVESVATQHNTITVDRELVSTCLEEALAKWTFHPPEETAVFEMEFRFADKC
ncbi:MAG: hypothetical protein KUG77_22920 [Nannocystaceae bacterium]|nr:hypothetical protein [Nannocystaceae bacterium]